MTKQKARQSKRTAGRTMVYIVGESPLVEEYARLCSERNFEVAVHWSSGEDQKKRPEDPKIRVSALPPPSAHLALEVTNTDIETKKKNLQKLDNALPATAAILSSSVAVTASEQAAWISRKHRLVGFGALPSMASRPLVEVAPTVHSPAETVEVVMRFFASIGKQCEFVQDRVGLVLPRILCQIVNEAFFALQDEIASPEDVDTAMKLGVNYPYGPVEWADRIGFRQVYTVLSALESDLREDRYRVAPLLKQLAQTGEWWKHRPQPQGTT